MQQRQLTDATVVVAVIPGQTLGSRIADQDCMGLLDTMQLWSSVPWFLMPPEATVPGTSGASMQTRSRGSSQVWGRGNYLVPLPGAVILVRLYLECCAQIWATRQAVTYRSKSSGWLPEYGEGT